MAHATSGHRAVITDPPALPWGEATHAAFPAQFRREARTLLLCWQRLGGGGGAGGSEAAGAAAGLGCLPLDLVRWAS